MVTGAGRGLGAAIADKLLFDGWSLSIGLRDKSQAKRFDVGSDRLHVGHFDALDSGSAKQWVNDTFDHFGKINALVNNAGVLRMVDFEKGSEDDLDYLWSVNVKAPFRLIQVALPYLKATGAGRVINIASTDAKRFRPGTSLGYSMTKHSLLVMTQAVRHAGWDHGRNP